MQYLRNLLYTKRPPLMNIIDIQLILAIIPHLFVLKTFMLIYLAISFVFILKYSGSKKGVFTLFLIGIVSITISFFSAYNFSDFSRMQFFVSLISSLLILAFTLQRLSKEINFYLKATPFMLLMLSFFFFDTMAMLFYSVFVFFVFILLGIWVRMDAPLLELIKFNSSLFLLSLPMVVVLFIAFPRISFEKAEFGFRADSYVGGSYDGKMDVGDLPFIGSGRVVMEVYFEDMVPPAKELYFRGSTLMLDAKFGWVEAEYKESEKLENSGDIIHYSMVFYPHGKKWLYPLGIPLMNPKKTFLQKDHTLKSKKNIYKQKRYKFASAMSYKLTSNDLRDALVYDPELYPKTFKVMQKIGEQNISSEEKVWRILKFFSDQKLAYTTRPKNLDPENVIDSFLFDSKSGYCIHFASTFAISARIAGIPSRVVSGYKADHESKIENYIVVKQKNAHAWVELYLDGRGWVRYEPTASAYRNLDERTKSEYNELFDRINNRYMYVKYMISNWILGYDRLKQLRILNSLLNDTIYLLKFIFSILGMILLSLIFFYLLSSSKPKDRLTKQKEMLFKILRKYGLKKEQNETMESFFKRSQIDLNVSFENISENYHRLKYSKDKKEFYKLYNAIKELKSTLDKNNSNT